MQNSKETVNFAVGGIGSATYIESMMLTNVMKLPVKVLTGYSGGDDQLAVRRSEITGSVASRSSWEQFVKNGYGKLSPRSAATRPTSRSSPRWWMIPRPRRSSR